MATNNNKKKKQYTVEHTVHLREWILLFYKDCAVEQLNDRNVFYYFLS